VTQLLVQRALSGDSLRVLVRRATWHMPAVSVSGLLSDSVGYARVTTISQGTTAELERAVDALVRHGARSLVLDLRGNGGGLFDEGVSAASLFLPRDAVVASLAGRSGAKPQVYRSKHSRWPSLPLTILVDAGTASAAEVIAAALRDHQRALLVGAPTYGKGVVQRVVRLTPDLSLRLTTARWLMPSGQSLQRRQGTPEAGSGGLAPDVYLDDPSYRDASTVPREWSLRTVSDAVVLADSLARTIAAESATSTPLAVVESRVRQRVLAALPRHVTATRLRVQWVGTLTQLVMVRVLEAAGADDALLRYALREDAALRAGLDVLAPGSTSFGLLPTDLSTAISPSR
jgi:carboxyl-terminal processing protease